MAEEVSGASWACSSSSASAPASGTGLGWSAAVCGAGTGGDAAGPRVAASSNQPLWDDADTSSVDGAQSPETDGFS